MNTPTQRIWISFITRTSQLLIGAVFIVTLLSGTTAHAEESIPVVATTGMVADMVRNIGGDRVSITQLMGEGVDPHLYRASPGDIRAMAGARIVFYNGLHLEGKLGEVLESLSRKKPVIAIGEAIDKSTLRSPPECEGLYDPHVWFDVSMWAQTGNAVVSALAAVDPDRKQLFQSNFDSYRASLNELDQWCKQEIKKIPLEARVLVTAHDAFGYFSRAYGMEVLAIQGVSTDTEASLPEVNRLVDTLVKRRIPAVFVESSVPHKTIEALIVGAKAQGHEVQLGGELFSDALGASGTPEGTYAGMVRHNVHLIVAALSKSQGATR